MRVTRSAAAPSDLQFTCEPHTEARKAALDAMRTWSDPVGLATFASARHGYHNTDGGFGVTYPGDLDDYDSTQHIPIPPNHVEVCAWYGERDGPVHLLLESEYLELLRQYLTLIDRNDAANQVAGFIASFAKLDPVR